MFLQPLFILSALLFLVPAGMGQETKPSPEKPGQKIPASPVSRLRVEPELQSRKLVNHVEPTYGPLAKAARISGTVKLHAVIAKDGSVQGLNVVSGHPLLVSSALDAVRQWRYQPTLVNGQPVEVETQIAVIFNLKNDASEALNLTNNDLAQGFRRLCSLCAFAQQPAAARQVFDGKMLPDVEVATFQHSETLFPVNTVPRKGPIRPLPSGSIKLQEIHFKSEGQDYDLFDYLAYNRVAGLLILKDGKVVFEDYELGISPQSRWISFSMAKSISSTLVGAAVQQGLISSLDDPVSRYVPQLKAGAYARVSIRNVLQMASGVKWDETYTDPNSDRRKLLELQLAHQPGAIVSYMNALAPAAAPGSLWNYSTGESFLAGAVLEGATHKPLATYLSETLWSRLGMEQDATWWVEAPGGMGLAGSGLGATLRDYARFGLFVLNDGVIEGQRVVPAGWFREAGSAHIIGGKSIDYGYFWWPIPPGDPIHQGAFQAEGIFGQHLYINPNEKLVIVVLSALPKPNSSYHVLDDNSFFAAVAKSLH
jgi:TonB family protein